MFKVVFLLDCDECGHSFDKGNVFSPAQPTCGRELRLSAELEMRRLEECSELNGWRFLRNYCICPKCIREEETMADWLQEPEDYKY
jgi:hypothetical protein